MLTLHETGRITGIESKQLAEMHADFAQYDIVRRIERWSIREFMRDNRSCLTGKVLDYGCGSQPYRDLVLGEYIPYDPHKDTLQTLADLNGHVDVIMCNQVMQYVPNVYGMLLRFRNLLRPDGWLVLTFATNWDEVEVIDLHRHTESGMKLLFEIAGFNVLRSVRRAEVAHGNFKFPLGYGMIGKRNDKAL